MGTSIDRIGSVLHISRLMYQQEIILYSVAYHVEWPIDEAINQRGSMQK